MLQGKVIIVTGSGRGIGREIALRAAAEGASVVVNDTGAELDGSATSKTPAAAVVEEIARAGGQAVANVDSVSDWNGANRIIEQALTAFGRVDAVINNAGILRDALIHKMTEAQWDDVIAVHLKGSFNMTRAATPHFRNQENGSMVYMTSPSGLIGNIGQANYSAAKMGIVGLSRSVALDLARYKICSNVIAPSAYTRMLESVPSKDEAMRIRREKLRTTMTPDRIAPLAVFLCSDAAREISGQIFAVRQNEIFLFNQPRPIRSFHRSDGWTPQSIAEQVLPAMRASFTPLETMHQVFCWDPI